MAPLRVIRIIRIDGPLGPRGLEELAALWTEVCGGIFAIGHTFGMKVQKVQKVQRVVVSPCGAQRTHFEGALATRKM